MAFVPPSISEEQQNQFAPTGVTTPNPMALLPPQQTGGSAGSGTGGLGTNPAQGTPTQFGSNASKLSDYLAANQDQTAQMGQNVAGQLSQQFGQVQADVGAAQQGGISQAQAGSQTYDPAMMDQFKANPTEFAKKPENVSGFQNLYNASYTGPNNFESTPTYSNIQHEVQGAVDNAGLVNSYPGLSTYLQNNVKGGTYTPGMNTLDTVLLQGNTPAYQKITDAAKPYSGLGQYLGDATANVNKGITAAQQASKDAKDQTRATYSGVANPFVQGLNQNYSDATKGSIDYNKQLNDISDKIANGGFAGLTPAEQSLIGYNPNLTNLIEKYPSIFPTQAQNSPINFSNFFTQGDQSRMPTPESVVKPDQIAEFQALSQLAGSDPTGLNFAMPTASNPMSGQTGVQPGRLPQYNNQGAAEAIEQAYRPMYNEATAPMLQLSGQITPSVNLPQSTIDYMNSLSSFETTPQPGPQPTTPMPAPGSQGDLGAGFHWDATSGAWVPTIPLQPGGGSDVVSGGTPITIPPPGGRVTR